ncbi:MAG: hypothetical protein EBZ77_13415, partial [Chitinophagia bacterium]|nr:hypothetical protein [Chitinophagia bacterium]
MRKDITVTLDNGNSHVVTWDGPALPTDDELSTLVGMVKSKYGNAQPVTSTPTGNGSMLRPVAGMAGVPKPKVKDAPFNVDAEALTRSVQRGMRKAATLAKPVAKPVAKPGDGSMLRPVGKFNPTILIPRSAYPDYTGEEDAVTAYGKLPAPNQQRGDFGEQGRSMIQKGLNKVTGGVVTALMPGIAGAMNDKDRAEFAEGIGEGANRLANDAAMFFVPGYGGAVMGYQFAPMIAESLKTGSTQPLIDGIGGFAEGLDVTGDKPLYDRVQAGINLVLTAIGIGHGVTELRAMRNRFSTGRITAKQIAKIAKEDPRVYQILTEAGYKPRNIAYIVNQSAEITAPEVSNKPKITGTERPAPILGQSRGATVTPKPTTESTVRPKQTSTVQPSAQP